MTSVAVAVNGGGSMGGKGSRRAVRWAVGKLMPEADRIVLVHVIPIITCIPTPSGDSIPIEELDGNVVAMYVQDMKARLEEVFIPYRRLCKTRKMETLVLEGNNPASALLRYVSESGIKSLVLGSCSSNCIMRKLKGPGVPSSVLKHLPDACNIYVVSRRRVITNSVNSLSTSESCSKHWLFSQQECGSRSLNKLPSGLYSCSVKCNVFNDVRPSSVLGSSDVNPQALMYGSSIHSSVDQEWHNQNLGDGISDTQTVYSSVSSTYTKQSDVQAELERLRIELHSTVSMYNRAYEDLMHTQNKVHLLSSDCLEESKRLNAAIKREETFRNVAAGEKEKRLEAVKEVEAARNLIAQEAYQRQIAELKARKESLEKQKIVDALFLSDRRYRRFSKDEIERATDFFSESKMIGEGAYGKVYKSSIDHTPVAIKVLHPDAFNKKEEFLREVEVLSQLRHPNMVLLLGACPEFGCLVYEYMENGSLEDYISPRRTRSSLPWFVRFRIAFQIACGLAFLHNSKPEPIVHRDLKPGNILLDRNYTSKIGDVGLAKLISDVVPDNVTEYRDSVLAGTFFYIDPEYLRTGTVRTKSDTYAFGLIILQLLADRSPKGLLSTVENAIACGSFSEILDQSVPDWPLAEAEELAQIALKCCGLRCRDRPDLDSEVLPVLSKLADFADASAKGERNNIDAPSHYYCPILQEVMDDPHIAADGFTYEHEAIKVWLERHNVSPVTKTKLQHKMVTPNHTLRAAIQDWKSYVHPLGLE